MSIQISAMTWIITMALMVPTTIYVHLRLPGMRRLLESITILPIVIPPIVLTVGVLQVFPVQLKATMWLLGIEYVILAMPFAYRSIDAGLRSIDLKTLTEASSNLGRTGCTTIWRVILPNLGTSLLSATVLIVALCLGEFTMASLNLVTTFPVWIVAVRPAQREDLGRRVDSRAGRDLALPDADRADRQPPGAPYRRGRGQRCSPLPQTPRRLARADGNERGSGHRAGRRN